MSSIVNDRPKNDTVYIDFVSDEAWFNALWGVEEDGRYVLLYVQDTDQSVSPLYFYEQFEPPMRHDEVKLIIGLCEEGQKHEKSGTTR